MIRKYAISRVKRGKGIRDTTTTRYDREWEENLTRRARARDRSCRPRCIRSRIEHVRSFSRRRLPVDSFELATRMFIDRMRRNGCGGGVSYVGKNTWARFEMRSAIGCSIFPTSLLMLLTLLKTRTSEATPMPEENLFQNKGTNYPALDY